MSAPVSQLTPAAKAARERMFAEQFEFMVAAASLGRHDPDLDCAMASHRLREYLLENKEAMKARVMQP